MNFEPKGKYEAIEYGDVLLSENGYYYLIICNPVSGENNVVIVNLTTSNFYGSFPNLKEIHLNSKIVRIIKSSDLTLKEV